MPIIRIDGDSPDVYAVIGPYAMDPKVIRKRQGLPIITRDNYTWFVLKEKEKVKAFVGVESLDDKTKLQAWVVLEATKTEQKNFLKEVVEQFNATGSPKLLASVLNEYADTFEKAKFHKVNLKKSWTDLAIVKT